MSALTIHPNTPTPQHPPPTHQHRFGGAPYFAFRPLTLVPIQAKLADAALMTPSEIGWLDAYHARVREGRVESAAWGEGGGAGRAGAQRVGWVNEGGTGRAFRGEVFSCGLLRACVEKCCRVEGGARGGRAGLPRAAVVCARGARTPTHPSNQPTKPNPKSPPQVWAEVSPRLQPGDTLEWLRRSTAPLAEQLKA